MLSMMKLECNINITLSWLEFSLEWWLKSSRGVNWWKSYIYTAVEETNLEAILAAVDTILNS